MPAEQVSDARIEAGRVDGPRFGAIAHGYQPPRKLNVDIPLGGIPYHAGFSVVPWVNDKITGQVYEPLLGEVERLPPGLVTSIYAPLRSYLKREKPDIYAHMVEAVRNTPDREYAVLGDPLVHVILPLLPSGDQLMLLQAGREAFINDFGFAPKGLWLPETAVSKEVLHNGVLAGYEFVPLRDSQVTNLPEGVRIDAQHNVCMVQTGGNEEIAVLLGNSELSRFVSYEPWSTYNAEEFLAGRQNNEQRYGGNALFMTDLERYGHHQEGADQFLKRVLEIQANYGFIPLNMREEIESFRKGRDKTYVSVVENSSWSCDHSLGRWTGTCCCDNPSEAGAQAKRAYYSELMDMNSRVNAALDRMSQGWRDEYRALFVSLSDEVFTGGNFAPALFDAVAARGESEETAKLYLAKTEIMVGLTSCGWFFGGDDRFERDIPSHMIQGVRALFQEQVTV